MLRSRHAAFAPRLGGFPGALIRGVMTHAKAYRVLGLESGAPREAVKSAYRAKALEFHPDKHTLEKRAVAQKK